MARKTKRSRPKKKKYGKALKHGSLRVAYMSARSAYHRAGERLGRAEGIHRSRRRKRSKTRRSR